MRRLLPLLLLGLLLLAAPAHALPPADSGTIDLAAGSDARYQGLVSFDVTGTGHLKNPRVWVACSQDGALVYGEGGSSEETFKLGGDMSDWVLNGGGPADCTATLYYILNAAGTKEWNGKGGQGETVTLAEVSFAAAG